MKSNKPKCLLNRRQFLSTMTAAGVGLALKVEAEPISPSQPEAFLVSNFHPGSCGWLTTFSRERVYCANSYLDHLDRVRDDPSYAFVMSEVNNLIAIMNFQPERVPELKRRIEEKRVELVNGFFLESTANLSGGEALVRLGIEGLRWYEQVMGVRPRFAWMIDICGTHDQMAQISSGLGLEAMVYTRCNPTGKTIYWSESPDGSRILTLCPGAYNEAEIIFKTKSPLNFEELSGLEKFIEGKQAITPEGAPILILAGSGDYSLAPNVHSYPATLLQQWSAAGFKRPIKFTTLSDYFDRISLEVRTGKIHVPTWDGCTAYDPDFGAFWIEGNKVKSLYRRNEHALQAAEMLATIASLDRAYEYPVQALNDAWVLMCLNMDRNTLWGCGAGVVFESGKSWDVLDRFHWVTGTTRAAFESSSEALLGTGESVALFNPLNWKRSDPVVLQLPVGKGLEGTKCEALPDGSVLCQIETASVSVAGLKLSSQAPAAPRAVELPDTIETSHYLARIDPKSGDLIGLKLKKSGRELLAAPANVIVAERPVGKIRYGSGDSMVPRPKRARLASSSDWSASIQTKQGPLALTIEVNGTFYGGGTMRRVVRFYHDYPRIDFETELNDVPDYTVVVAEFPLAEDILDVRRGVPYGFSHSAWSKPNPQLHGWAKGIVPAIRWIDFSLANGGGVAILDRGLTGREFNGRTPIIYLLNAVEKYHGLPNPWMSGKGKHNLEYSILPHEQPWDQARVPQMAWEYNRPPEAIPDRAAKPERSYIQTSDNVILEALRREGDHMELRFVECLGRSGTATVRVLLPHRNAVLTDLTGRKQANLPDSSTYRLPVRPQQIVTMRFETAASVTNPEPITAWDQFVSPEKLPALHRYDPNLKGHPPFGD